MSKQRTEIITHTANLCIGGVVALVDPVSGGAMAATGATGLVQIGHNYRANRQARITANAIEAKLKAELAGNPDSDDLKEAILILEKADIAPNFNRELLVSLNKQGQIETEFTQYLFDQLNTQDRTPLARKIAKEALLAGITAAFEIQEIRTKLATEASLDAARVVAKSQEDQKGVQEQLAEIQAAIAAQGTTHELQSEVKRLTELNQELQKRINDPEAELAKAQNTITELTSKLDRVSNILDQGKIDAAKEAMGVLDFTLARELLEDLRAKAELRKQDADQELAEIEYDLGLIAEAEIRWYDAAKHFEKSADLYPTFKTCERAGKQNWLNGKPEKALHYVSQMKNLADTDELKSFALNSEAILYQAQGKYAVAEPLSLQAKEITKKVFGEDHPNYASSLNTLAELYRAQGKYHAAEPLLLQAMEISRKSLGEDHPNYSIRLNNLAELYCAQGEHDAAEPLYLQAMEITKNTLGEDHPTFATRLNNLAELYRSLGKYAAAEPLFLQAKEIRKNSLGEDHPDYAIDLNNLAGLYRAQGKYDAAEPLFLQAMEISKNTLGEDHPSYAIDLNNLALLYNAQGKRDAALPLYVQALKILDTALGRDHPDTQLLRSNYELFLKDG